MAEENSSANEKENSNGKREKQSPPTATPIWEWIIAGVGLILVVGAVGSMCYRALTEEKTPPALEIVVDGTEPSGGGFLVRFRVKNTGSQTAAAVAVEGELKKGTETVEQSAATLTYSPAHSARRGGLYFTKNPAEYDLQIRATGYEEP